MKYNKSLRERAESADKKELMRLILSDMLTRMNNLQEEYEETGEGDCVIERETIQVLYDSYARWNI